MHEFFDMGGYGAYVWSAWGFAALAMIALLVQSLRLARRRTAELEELRSRMRTAGRPRRAPLRPVRMTPSGPGDTGE